MNGALIPAILYYVVTFHPTLAGEPLSFIGPWPRAACIEMVRDVPDAECRAFNSKPRKHR